MFKTNETKLELVYNYLYSCRDYELFSIPGKVFSGLSSLVFFSPCLLLLLDSCFFVASMILFGYAYGDFYGNFCQIFTSLKIELFCYWHFTKVYNTL